MIKINLLDSATERPRGFSAVEQKVTNPQARMWVLALVIGGLFFSAASFDLFSARSSRSNAQSELENQKRIAVQMAETSKELADLEKKTNAIKTRIAAIQKLRASQRGPVAVLDALNERLPALADFQLASVEQKGTDLVIKGDSPNESSVTQFARSMEFSSGLFTNVSIETERKPLEVAAAYNQNGSPAPAAADANHAADVPKPETVGFTVKCKYTAPVPTIPSASQSATASRKNDQMAQK